MQSPGPTDSPAWACRRPGRLLRPPAPAIARPTLPPTPPHHSADCADGAGVGHRDSKQCRAGPGGSQARHGPADGHRSQPGASGHHQWHRAQQPLLPQPPLCCCCLPATVKPGWPGETGTLGWSWWRLNMYLRHVEPPAPASCVSSPLATTSTANSTSQSPHLTPPHPARGPETVRSERDNAVKESESHRTIIHCRKALAKPDAAIQ